MPLYRTIKPLLFRVDPETAHSTVTTVLRAAQGTPALGLLRTQYTIDHPRLRVSAFGNEFPNPVGVAAGFDKNAEIPTALAALGFGHVEIGGVTAEAQRGNPRPRLFRLTDDHALINRMGFNNDGADRVADRLARNNPVPVPLGINIGKSKSTPLDRAEEDYLYTYDRIASYGDYFVVNVSSPNTPGLRELQQREPLDRILSALKDAGASPLLLKVSPDLSTEQILEAVSIATDRELDGIIATNTTVDRPESLRSIDRVQAGGLSGKPLQDRATRTVELVATNTSLPVIGVGGVFTAADAYEKIRAGATLVQLYTGLIYEGPSIARSINEGLLDLLDADGYDTITDAIGTGLS